MGRSRLRCAGSNPHKLKSLHSTSRGWLTKLGDYSHNTPIGNYSRVMGVLSIYRDTSALRLCWSASVRTRKLDDAGEEYPYVWCGLSLSLL